MKKLLLLLPLLLLAFGCSKSPEQQKQDLFDKGLSQIEKYQFTDADTLFSKINELDPESPLGLYGKGMVLEAKQQFYDAIATYMTIADAKPDFAPADLGLFRSFSALGYYSDAFTTALVFNRLKSDDPLSYYILAKAALRIDNPKRAVEAATLGLAKSPSDPAPLEFMLATGYRMTGNLDSASATAAKAFSHGSRTAAYYETAADYLESTGQIDSAMTLSRMAYETGKSTDAALQYFNRALRAKYFTAASQLLDQMDREKVPDIVVAKLRLDYKLAQGDKMGARQAGDSLQITDQTSISSVMYGVDARGAVGDMLSVTQDLPVLAARIATGNFVQPFRQFMTYAMGIKRARYDLSIPVIAELQKIRDVHSNLREVKLRLALCFWACGLEDSCFATVKTSFDGHQNQPEWLTQIGDIYSYISMRRYDDAANMYRQALEKNPWYIPAFASYVNMYTVRANPDSALIIFEKYPYFAENNPVLALRKATILVEAGKVDEGLKLFEAKIPADRGDVTKFSQLLNLLEKKGLKDNADAVNELLVELNPEDAQALVLAARYNSRNMRPQAAFDYAERAVKLDTMYAEAAVLQAQSLYQLGKTADAIKLFESNLSRFPHDALNQFYFSQALANENIDLNRAANLAREAVFNAFGNADYVLNLSNIYYRMGRYDLSRGEAMKASNAEKDNPLAYYRYGMASYRLDGKKDDARVNLKKALDLGLSGQEKDSAKLVLGKL